MANQKCPAPDPCTIFCLSLLQLPQSPPRYLASCHAYCLSLFAVQNFVPERNGLVGNSRIRVLSVAEFLSPDELTGLRKTSTESLVPKKTVNTIALRSLTDAQISPLMSKAMPSTPSSLGSARKRFSRQRVLSLNVRSQPVWLLTGSPFLSNVTSHSAPLA